jgi:hypothetical protein
MQIMLALLYELCNKKMKKIQGAHLKNVIGQMLRWLDEVPDEGIAITWYGKVRAVILSRQQYEKLSGEDISD